MSKSTLFLNWEQVDIKSCHLVVSEPEPYPGPLSIPLAFNLILVVLWQLWHESFYFQKLKFQQENSKNIFL